jgi:CRISPR-associated endonuclease/helicase Cas3
VNFPHLFPTITKPRKLQRAIDDLPDAAVAGPLLAVIEAPTGEGKTEAALALGQRLAACAGRDELFFALPTMATSNQMFQRLSRFYDDRYGAAVRLTHSQAAVSEEELRRAALAGDQDAAEPEAASALAAIEWFAGSKKAMLAPFGVGTVDQVELAGLNVRHYVLRLFALAGKVVIIDEVHAYDAYMSVILEHTLAWLASLGTSVLLLSATLPATRHRALAASYMRGLDKRLPAPEVPTSLPYPVISLYSAGASHRAMPEVFRPDQRLTLRMAPKLEPEQDARHLIDLVRDGGAVARICNRVDDAQAIYRALKALRPPGQCILLHARFPLNQRQRLEREIDALVGKETQRTPDQPLIIVGTQVLEQSLDYDVDVMVSDFAPIDLLLQRAGRLHRHVTERAGQRPRRHAQPVLEVVFPRDPDDLPVWKRWERIYDAYILWRTWEVLRAECQANACEIVLPGDYRRLIEAVYQDAPQIPVDAPQSAAMAKAWAKLEQIQGEMCGHARKQLTPAVTGTDAITAVADMPFVEDEAGELAGWQVAKTRLGDRITVVPLYRVDGALSLSPMPYSGFELSPDTPPEWDEQRALIERSISISDPRIMAEFRAEQRRELRWPWPARQVPRLLRSLFPLLLDPTTHTARFAAGTLRLDQELGLLIEKEDV